MDNLKILYLYSNKIQKIQNKTFDNLKSLEKLWLDRNEIKEIDKNSFDGMDNLKIYIFIQIKFKKYKIKLLII
jgi:Leucine-rich repeat (LRR) protein